MPGILRRKVSPIYSVLLLVVALFFYAYSIFLKKTADVVVQTQTPVTQSQNPATNYRMNNYEFAHPLLLSDEKQESSQMQGLKNEVDAFIEAKKKSGELLSAAVHIMNLNDSKYICINPNERFNPGSLFKVPVMMSYLRESERKPGLLEQKLLLPAGVDIPSQTFAGKSIERNKNYTIRELLYYMIVESDNNATALLNKNVNINEFSNFFKSIGVSATTYYDKDFSFSVEEYSRFMRILYNASYLSLENADYALSLLAQAKFKDGMTKYLPADIEVAHKFGEAGDSTPNGVKQMHESGIIYLSGGPILLDIMTKGKDVHVLVNVIAEISKLVYDRTLQRGKPS